MEKMENRKSIVKALLKVQNEIKNPKSSEINPYYRSKYAPLPDILNLVRPLLNKHGLVIYQDVGSTKDGAICVRTHLIHESGESLTTSPLYMKPETKGNKGSTPQAMGSAITYARRYQILALLGIASEDDDANLASRPRPTTTPTPRPTR